MPKTNDGGICGETNLFSYSPKSSIKILVLVSLILFSIILVGFNWEKKTVTLIMDGQEEDIITRADNWQQFLKEQKIVLGKKDEVVFSSEKLKQESSVEILRSHNVELYVDGYYYNFETTAKNIENAIEEKGISLGKHDQITPSLEERILKDESIKIIRVEIKTETKEIEIPYESIREDNYNMELGTMEVSRKGVNGLKQESWKLVYYDGQLVKETLLESTIASEPISEIIQMGQGNVISRGGVDFRYSKEVEVVATAYTHTGNRTATGVMPTRGIIAVDTSVFPFGTKLYIEDYGLAVASDTGGAIKGNKIDLFMESGSEARQWGVRNVKAYILE